ncbi:GNAT family N-acetyltransferase [Kitasatospora sp. NPDC059795]|uniref:GNAT family N-acetyltransferase n=1 Tax=Kitasatospora sp. NPDC059795 TaxID=3346949 RepID=UPI00364E27FA
MTNSPLLQSVWRRWEGLAGVPAPFPAPGGATVVVSPDSGLCPPGWVGLIALGGAVLATAPDERRAALVRAALRERPAELAGDPEQLRQLLPLAGTLGPAALAYLPPDGLLPQPPADLTVHQLPPTDPRLRDLERRTGRTDAEEAGLDGLTSPAFAVLTADDRVIAACGYRAWPFDTAHFAVLTDPAHRNQGLARHTATAAAHHARSAGLLPQWRARIPASQRVATHLGFHPLGTQLSAHVP